MYHCSNDNLHGWHWVVDPETGNRMRCDGDDLKMMMDPDLWPHREVLPLIRRPEGGGEKEYGTLLYIGLDTFLFVPSVMVAIGSHMSDGVQYNRMELESLIKAGWEVD